MSSIINVNNINNINNTLKPRDEIRSVLEGEEYRDPLISDGSVLDVSQTFRASTARELRNKYMGKIESGKQQDFTRSVSFIVTWLGFCYVFVSRMYLNHLGREEIDFFSEKGLHAKVN